jgi:signal transduction histidine kinase
MKNVRKQEKEETLSGITRQLANLDFADDIYFLSYVY